MIPFRLTKANKTQILRALKQDIKNLLDKEGYSTTRVAKVSRCSVPVIYNFLKKPNATTNIINIIAVLEVLGYKISFKKTKEAINVNDKEILILINKDQIKIDNRERRKKQREERAKRPPGKPGFHRGDPAAPKPDNTRFSRKAILEKRAEQKKDDFLSFD